MLLDTIKKGKEGMKTIVFVQKKRTATVIKKKLISEGITATEIHGDRSQSQRESALSDFKLGKAAVLVATDVAARGLDIPLVEHVINVDLPTSVEEFDSYVHRIGRTGRAGNKGVATSFYVPGHAPKVGNGALASLLRQFLIEAEQEVPFFLIGGLASTPAHISTSASSASSLVSTSNNGIGDDKGRGRGRGRREGDAVKERDFRSNVGIFRFSQQVNKPVETSDQREVTVVTKSKPPPALENKETLVIQIKNTAALEGDKRRGGGDGRGRGRGNEREGGRGGGRGNEVEGGRRRGSGRGNKGGRGGDGGRGRESGK